MSAQRISTAAAVIAILGLAAPAAAQAVSQVKDIHATGSAAPAGLTEVGDKLFFHADEGGVPTYGTNLPGIGLWTSTGTAAGTSKVVALPNDDQRYLSGFTALDGRLIFHRNTWGAFGAWNSYKLRSDGTAAGTQVLDTGSVSAHGNGCGLFSNLPATWTHVYYAACNWYNFRATDGTSVFPIGSTGSAATETTSQVHLLLPMRNWGLLRLFPRVGGIPGTPELFALRGTDTPAHFFGSLDQRAYLDHLSRRGEEAFFSYRPQSGSESSQIWKTDGTAAGTQLVVDMTADVRINGIAVIEHTVFFAISGVSTHELWKTDGTAGGTALVQTGGVAAPGFFATASRGQLMFTFDDGVNGRELWVSDGTTAGTSMLKDIRPGSGGSNPANAVRFAGQMYFTADDGVHGTELWRTDGTPEGTVLAADIAPGVASSAPSGLTRAAGRMFLAADDGVTGRELWATERRIEPADATGDGIADLLRRDASGAERVLHSTTRRFFAEQGDWPSVAPAAEATDAYFADVTGDGRADYIRRKRTDGLVEVYRSEGDRFVRVPGGGPDGSWTWGFDAVRYELSFADVDGDGRADLVSRVRAEGDPAGSGLGDVWVFPARGNGFSSAESALWSYGWTLGYDVLFADVTGDGRADLVGRYFGLTEGLTGDVYVAVSNGTGFVFDGRWTYGFSAGYDLYLADADADGRSDLVSRYSGPAPGLTGDVHVLRSTGTAFSWGGHFERWTYGWGSTYEILVRDVTGDGRADLLGRDPATGELLVAANRGTAFTFAGVWAAGLDTAVEIR
jgi:ELWxxDGT repeat protein